jgi:diacylglycerol kinase (ATP)
MTDRDKRRSLILLVNPAAGSARAKRIAALAAREFEAAGVSLSVRKSAGPGHLVELAAAAAGEEADIAVCGGDGSLNEVINGLGTRDRPLGIIPGGRGDDVARNLGIPLETAAACRSILAGARRSVDLVRAGSRLYTGIGGAGVDSEVTRRANESRLPLRGHAVYTWAVLRTLSSFRPYHFTIEADGWNYEGDVMFAGVANNRSYGGGMILSPPSRPDDGVIEVCIIEKRSRLSLLASFPRLFRGTHLNLPGVKLFRCRRLHIASDRPADFYADGEPMGKLPIDIEVIPGALDILVPPSGVPKKT